MLVYFTVLTQGTSKSMPWLADLVESNDSSLDVLPVQCLCEFLLHDSTSDSSAYVTGDDTTQAERHKKQVGSGTDFSSTHCDNGPNKVMCYRALYRNHPRCRNAATALEQWP